MELQPYQSGLQVGLASDPGCSGEGNEDAVFAWQLILPQPGQPPWPMGLFIVADGMGGHLKGEQASALAIRLAAHHVIRQVCLPLLVDDAGAVERPPINEVLEASMRIAHQAVLRQLPEAGTTMTMALLLGDSVFIAHVGDSRAYLGERGHLHHLTQDHSIAARLVDMGQATPEEVAAQRNILYKALGRGANIEPDILYRDMDRRHYLLVCSDGLWSTVPEEKFAAIVEAAATPTSACHNLVAQAKEQGGEDNISVILVARDWPLPVCAPEQTGNQGEPFDLDPPAESCAKASK
jgi:serine/threonine protein phosphatase PrpC